MDATYAPPASPPAPDASSKISANTGTRRGPPRHEQRRCPAAVRRLYPGSAAAELRGRVAEICGPPLAAAAGTAQRGWPNASTVRPGGVPVLFPPPRLRAAGRRGTGEPI